MCSCPVTNNNHATCPSCGRTRLPGEKAPQCDCELGLLAGLEQRVDGLRRRARREYSCGRYRSAAALAQRLVCLDAAPPHLRLLACARVMAGDYAGGYEACRQALAGDQP
jgi:hypothetical protein